jgi:integrase
MVEQPKSVGDGAQPGGDAQTGKLLASAPSEPLRSHALPARAGHLTIHAVIELYMAQYTGRDSSRGQRLGWWIAQIGSIPLSELTDDEVHSALAGLSSQTSRYYAGKDADGRAVHKAKKRQIAPATINRYAAALAAVITWAIKRRIAPRGFVHPCRTVERQRENNEKTRFLSPPERERLLEACRSSSWARLYLLVLMALTTGARKGELLGLRWCDVDFTMAVARCGRTKNGDPKILPLIPAVLQSLRDQSGPDEELVFRSKRFRTRPFSFESRWQEALKRANIKTFRFHDLRHTCASILAQNGATLLEIGDVLGHRQLQMTKRYSHLTVSHKAALINRVLGRIDEHDADS